MHHYLHCFVVQVFNVDSEQMTIVHDVGQVCYQLMNVHSFRFHFISNIHFTVINTQCRKEQDDYDKMKKNGTLGQFMLRPECDVDGLFKATKCIPGQM